MKPLRRLLLNLFSVTTLTTSPQQLFCAYAIYGWSLGHITRSTVWILVYFKVHLENEFVVYLGPIQNSLMVFNSSINFGIYLIFNKKFKNTFFGLFTRKRKVWQQIQMQTSSQLSNIEQQQRFLQFIWINITIVM